MDELVTRESRHWAPGVHDDSRPDLVIDAAGARPSSRAGPVDAHHGQARFRWAAGPADVLDGPGDAPVVGFDVVVVDDEGRISSVYGFLDAVPS